MTRVIFIGLILLLYACSGVKDTLTIKKKPAADEFLVEKKSPLVVPPDYGKLPKPITIQANEEKIGEKSENEIKKLFTNKENISSENKQSQSSSLEDIILEKIK
tara:strand:+ start:1025 stop:1336 length:312 start_codon:yes stop_codon:yes gene_type:complete